MFVDVVNKRHKSCFLCSCRLIYGTFQKTVCKNEVMESIQSYYPLVRKIVLPLTYAPIIIMLISIDSVVNLH